MAGLKVVPIKTLADGSLDIVDLKEKAEKHKDNLAAFMVSIIIDGSQVDVSLIPFCFIDHVSFNLWCVRRWCSGSVQDHP